MQQEGKQGLRCIVLFLCTTPSPNCAAKFSRNSLGLNAFVFVTVLDDNVISPAQAAALAASDTTVKPEQDVFVPVPCMETKKCDEDHAAYHSAICSSTSPPPLFLVLKGFSSFPEPLFYRFVSLFVAKWKSKPFLEGNRVVLHLADGLELELVYSTRAVIATVFPFDSEERPSDEEIRQHCIGVRESLVQELTHAIRNGMDDFHFELCVHPPIKPKCENDMYKDLACLDRYLIDSTLVKQNGQRIRTPKQLCLWYPAKEISKSVKMESTKLQPGPHVQSFTKVEKLVVKYGQSQWFSFGLELGFTKDEIDAACYDKPAPSQKLQTIICSKIQEIGAEKTRQKLLDACQCVPSPIYGIVKENLQTKE